MSKPVVVLRITEAQLAYLRELVKTDEGAEAGPEVHYDALLDYLNREYDGIHGP